MALLRHVRRSNGSNGASSVIPDVLDSATSSSSEDHIMAPQSAPATISGDRQNIIKGIIASVTAPNDAIEPLPNVNNDFLSTRNRTETETSTTSATSICSDTDGIVRVNVTEDMQDSSSIESNPHPIVDNSSSVNIPSSSHSANFLQAERSIQTSNLNPGLYTRQGSSSDSSRDLPDILHSHLPPPYETLPNTRSNRRGRPNISIRMPDGGHRIHRNRRRQQTVVEENPQCKCNSCSACLTTLTHFKWVLVILSVLGLTCILTGIILGALHMSGASYLTLSLMFIGLGVMLVIVVIVAWRCRPAGHEPCHLLFGLGGYTDPPRRSSRSHRRQDTGIPQWHGGVLYPECAHRQPPPSYNVSMQQYERQLQVRLSQSTAEAQLGSASLPSSPPPTYRSRAGTMRPGLHITFPQLPDNYPSSRPPTYRSHISNTGTLRRPSLVIQTNEAVCGGNGPISLQVNTVLGQSSLNASCGVENVVVHIENDNINSDTVTVCTEVPNNVNEQNISSDNQVSCEIQQDNPNGGDTLNLPPCVHRFGTAERHAVECFERVLADSYRDDITSTQELPLIVQDDIQHQGGVDNLGADIGNELPHDADTTVVL